MMPLRAFRVPATIQVGTGASALTGAEVKRLGAQSALLITDKFLLDSGTVAPVLESLKQAGVRVEIYAGVDKEPTLAHVDESLALLKQSGCEAVIGCGGGSPIDVAKAVSALSANPGKIQDYMGIDKIPNRGVPITCFMINNSVFGMTGGQMSPTSLAGQVTATTTKGRDIQTHGYPLLLPEMMRAMPGVAYLARETVVDAKSINKAAKSVRNAFECQIKKIGFSYVEFIVPCPTGLKMGVMDAYAWCAKEALDWFKPQVFKNELEQSREV